MGSQGELDSFLETHGLGQYTEALRAAGYDDMLQLKEMAALGEDFVTCTKRDAGLKAFHARWFQKKLLDSVSAPETGASTVCDSLHADLRHAAEEAKTEAVQLLRQLESMCAGWALQCCRVTLLHLEGPGPRDAFLAYCAARRVAAECALTDDAQLRTAATRAEHATCDVLAWQCQVCAGLGCRQRFLEELRSACLNVVDFDLEERVLHSHSLTVALRFPSSFLSRNKSDSLKRGRALRAKKKRNHHPQMRRSWTVHKPAWVGERI